MTSSKTVIAVALLLRPVRRRRSVVARRIRARFVKDAETSGVFMAGAAKVNATMPVGTPLAGFNHGDRRVPDWPLPVPREYTFFMEPSQGHIPDDGTWTKALVLDNGVERIAFVTLDGIGSDGTLNRMTVNIAQSMGSTIEEDKIIFGSSHSHSGPGAISPELLWALAPATDLLNTDLQTLMATKMATALVNAEKAMQPAAMAIGQGYLVGVTKNRRASYSPYVEIGTIDPWNTVTRVDDLQGNPIATMWNFAIHGVCYGPSNMLMSGDIMGRANQLIEEQVGGVSLFFNSDAGDIDPAAGMCDGGNETVNHFKGSTLMAANVVQTRTGLKPSTEVEIRTAAQTVEMGRTDLNYTLARFNNCTHGGPLDVCSLCDAIDCDVNAHMSDSWIEENPIFTAFAFTIDGVDTVMATVPGEALVELGWQIKNDTLDLGFDQTAIYGYSNSHLGYFCTPDEYDIGGYESQLTFWGIKTSAMIRTGSYTVTSQVAPKGKANPAVAPVPPQARR